MNEIIEKLIYKAIYNWVAENYGTSEADDPSWSIEALAHGLAHSTLVYDIQQLVEREYRRQDMQSVLEDMNVELTEQEQGASLDEFMNSESYVDMERELWTEIIEHTIELRKEK